MREDPKHDSFMTLHHSVSRVIEKSESDQWHLLELSDGAVLELSSYRSKSRNSRNRLKLAVGLVGRRDVSESD